MVGPQQRAEPTQPSLMPHHSASKDRDEQRSCPSKADPSVKLSPGGDGEGYRNRTRTGITGGILGDAEHIKSIAGGDASEGRVCVQRT